MPPVDLRTNQGGYWPYFDEYTWFRQATVEQILNVELHHQGHLHWPGLDVDLWIYGLFEPDEFPMNYREAAAVCPWNEDFGM